jgi:hypothetical protein
MIRLLEKLNTMRFIHAKSIKLLVVCFIYRTSINYSQHSFFILFKPYLHLFIISNLNQYFILLLLAVVIKFKLYL